MHGVVLYIGIFKESESARSATYAGFAHSFYNRYNHKRRICTRILYRDSYLPFASSRIYHVEIRLLHNRYHSLCLRDAKKYLLVTKFAMPNSNSSHDSEIDTDRI